MQRKRKKRSRTLSQQVFGMVVTAFPPVNLLAIVVSGMILYQSSRQAQASYQSELDTVMNRLQADLEDAEAAFSEFVLDYLTELNMPNTAAPMSNYNMIQDLEEVFDECGSDGLYYLYDKAENRVYLRYTSGVYPVLLTEAVKEALRGQCEAASEQGEEPAGQWQLAVLEGEYFLHRQYEYANYRIGFLPDMQCFLREQAQSRLWRQNQVYVRSGGRIYLFQEERLRLSEEESWEGLFRDGLLSRDVRWQQEASDLAVGIRMEEEGFRGGIPIAYQILMAVAVCSILLAVWMWKMLKTRVISGLLVLYQGMKKLEGDFDYRIAAGDCGQAEEFQFLYECFNRMAQELGLARQKDIQMVQVQLDNLRLQVNPHMLLNSFNMIYGLAQTKNFACIQEYSLLLVEYFRYALKDTGRLVTLEREMEFVENYTNIQKIRFPGAFTSVYHIQEGCQEALLPPLLIENFVENAMKYALKTQELIEVLINVRQEEERLLISVCDTGRGIKPEILECLQKGEIYVDKMGRQHIGVWNCRRRLEVFYGDRASLKLISSPGEGTQVWLELPFQTGEGGNGEVKTHEA